MPHAIQIRRTGGPEVLNRTAVDVGEPGSGQARLRQAALGATVIGTVSTQAKAEMAHAHGCSHTILYAKQDFVAEVSRVSGGEKLPVVFDSVGKDTCLRSLDCLRPRGLMVTFGQASGPIDPIAPVLLSQKGSLFLTRPILFHYIQRRSHGIGSARNLGLHHPDH
jgi:NADPH2:quinone reductase